LRVKRLGWVVFLILFLAAGLRPQTLSSGLQDPARKPPSDYMDTFLSRNTRALGLKEDKVLTRLMKQPAVAWAVRSAERHVLD
jgi:hypothetical protein